MNDEELNQLFAQARNTQPDTSRQEYSFETRLLARIREERADALPKWAWRLTPWFACVALALGIWTWNLQGEDEFSFADNGDEDSQLVEYLAGGNL